MAAGSGGLLNNSVSMYIQVMHWFTLGTNVKNLSFTKTNPLVCVNVDHDIHYFLNFLLLKTPDVSIGI